MLRAMAVPNFPMSTVRLRSGTENPDKEFRANGGNVKRKAPTARHNHNHYTVRTRSRAIALTATDPADVGAQFRTSPECSSVFMNKTATTDYHVRTRRPANASLLVL